MHDWNPSYNWTKGQVLAAMFRAEARQVNRAVLDVEHSGAGNIADIIAWANKHDWDGDEDARNEAVVLIRRDGPFDMFLHVTTKTAVPGIMEKGLVPAIGPRAEKISEKAPAVYLFTSEAAMEDAVSNWLGDQLPEDEELSVLEIRLPIGYRDDIVQDPGIGYEAKCRRAIPARYITVRERDPETAVADGRGA